MQEEYWSGTLFRKPFNVQFLSVTLILTVWEGHHSGAQLCCRRFRLQSVWSYSCFPLWVDEEGRNLDARAAVTSTNNPKKDHSDFCTPHSSAFVHWALWRDQWGLINPPVWNAWVFFFGFFSIYWLVGTTTGGQMFKRRVRAPFFVFGCLLKADAAGWRLGPSCANRSPMSCIRRVDGWFYTSKATRSFVHIVFTTGTAGCWALGILGLHTVTCYWLFKWRLASINLIWASLNGRACCAA